VTVDYDPLPAVLGYEPTPGQRLDRR